MVLPDLIGPEIPFKLGDLCWLVEEETKDSFFLHGEFSSTFVVSTTFTVLSFGELEDLTLALADSVAAMYVGSPEGLEGSSFPKDCCLL